MCISCNVRVRIRIRNPLLLHTQPLALAYATPCFPLACPLLSLIAFLLAFLLAFPPIE